MLAHSFDKHASKINYPAYISPKLDGIRCIAVVKNKKATLWTRTGKPITSMTHVVEELEEIFENVTLDGELYNNEYRDNFEEIVSQVRNFEPQEGHKKIEYHVFDVVNNDIFDNRLKYLEKTLYDRKYIKLVPQILVPENKVALFTNGFISLGAEGAMIRNVGSLYEHKRSFNLQKIKFTQDEEFDIIGVVEGKGKLLGHVGAFILQDKANRKFNVKLEGSLELLKPYLSDSTLWKGKKMTVRFQGYTKKGIPRFPVGVVIRDYE